MSSIQPNNYYLYPHHTDNSSRVRCRIGGLEKRNNALDVRLEMLRKPKLPYSRIMLLSAVCTVNPPTHHPISNLPVLQRTELRIDPVSPLFTR
jgi:hypothetical protein